VIALSNDFHVWIQLSPHGTQDVPVADKLCTVSCLDCFTRYYDPAELRPYDNCKETTLTFGTGLRLRDRRLLIIEHGETK
jgi:hypothetical protein